MYSTKLNDKEIHISFKKKISFFSFSDIIDLKIDGQSQELSPTDLSFDCIGMHDEMNGILCGHFLLDNGLVFSNEQSIEIQKEYIKWENSTLSKNKVTFKLINGSQLESAGIPQYNPFFHALLNREARVHHLYTPNQLGEYFYRCERHFAWQFVAFNTGLIKHIKTMLTPQSSGSYILSGILAEFVFKDAVLHISKARNKYYEGDHQNSDYELFFNHFVRPKIGVSNESLESNFDHNFSNFLADRKGEDFEF